MNHRTKTIWLPAIAILFATGLVLVFMNRAAVLQLLIWVACTVLLLCAAATEANRLNYRTKTLWRPALTTFLAASVSLMLCQLLGLKPHITWVGPDAIWFYWPWLLTLPIFGALGALLSRRAGGPVALRLAAGLSPALIMFTVMLVVLPLSVAIDGFHLFQLVSFGLLIVNWVALPALALLIGELPFLRLERGQST